MYHYKLYPLQLYMGVRWDRRETHRFQRFFWRYLSKKCLVTVLWDLEIQGSDSHLTSPTCNLQCVSH
jgi:hypothetical protein